MRCTIEGLWFSKSRNLCGRRPHFRFLGGIVIGSCDRYVWADFGATVLVDYIEIVTSYGTFCLVLYSLPSVHEQ